MLWPTQTQQLRNQVARLYHIMRRQATLIINRTRRSLKCTVSTNADATMLNNRSWRDQNNDMWSALCRNYLTTNSYRRDKKEKKLLSAAPNDWQSIPLNILLQKAFVTKMYWNSKRKSKFWNSITILLFHQSSAMFY